ncbi:MAG: TetR family transcriptional regulator [Phenylobacterium sp.]|uniref:TetR/AcrR family transcriptional regulator n=1 Tax=Phenylobacterium sp. TaxID=1871053 RepID=UPI0025E5CE51|nr:TetR/AcrR family transcriptional regulator [Phenylobacterium sp.]MBI1200472.1 TetR family transcriptional regulator [Phenylobacterium sp.]
MVETRDSARAPGRRGRAGERREEVLAQATRLFAEHGVHAVSTRQIAQAVGISQPSLYAHFPTKQALVEAVCVRAFEALSARMIEVMGRIEGPAVLDELARAYVDFALAEPDAYRIALMDEGAYETPEDGPNAAMAAGGAAFKLYRAAIVRELGAGLGEVDQDMLAQSIWASLHGLVALLIARPTFDWCDRERLIAFHIARLHGA